MTVELKDNGNVCKVHCLIPEETEIWSSAIIEWGQTNIWKNKFKQSFCIYGLVHYRLDNPLEAEMRVEKLGSTKRNILDMLQN